MMSSLEMASQYLEKRSQAGEENSSRSGNVESGCTVA